MLKIEVSEMSAELCR